MEFTGNAFEVEFDRQRTDRWPDVTPPIKRALRTSGCEHQRTWYCSGVVQFWTGRSLGDSAPPHLVGREWFYDAQRWGPMLGYQPQDGETVGIFVAAGNLRDGAGFTQASCPRVCERSNVAFVRWGSSAGF